MTLETGVDSAAVVSVAYVIRGIAARSASPSARNLHDIAPLLRY